MLGRLLCVRGCVVEKVDDREQRRDEDEKEEEGGFLYTPRLSTYSSYGTSTKQTGTPRPTSMSGPAFLWPHLPCSDQRERERKGNPSCPIPANLAGSRASTEIRHVR